MKYSINDIDRMRSHLRLIITYQYKATVRGWPQYRAGELEGEAERRLQTYIVARITPDEVDAEYEKWNKIDDDLDF